MREILFRGKRVIDGKWVESCCPLGEMHSGTVTYDFVSGTVCQYTGLIDWNGRKIFDGDIVDSDGTIGIVKFGKYKNDFHYGYYIEWNECPLLRQELGFWNGRSKIVGNIFDNPEFLKGDLRDETD